MALALTSALAGTASAPFGAYHFGRIQIYFVVANMIAVPLTALWVMPAGLIGLLLMPFGLDWLAFVPMGWGAQAILWVARTTAGWPAATLDVPHMPPWGLALTGFGIAWLGLWRSRLRLIGAPVIALGLISPLLVRPPDLLVSADARLIGVRAGDTLYLQSASGASSFTRDAWAQYLATGPPQTDRQGWSSRPTARSRVSPMRVCCGPCRRQEAPCWSAAPRIRTAAGKPPSSCRRNRRGAYARAPGRRWWIASPSGATVRPRSGWTHTVPAS